MALTREDLRAAFERAGDDQWHTLVRYHEDAYPASRPTPGDICRGEAARLNAAGFGNSARYELIESRASASGNDITLVHVFKDKASGSRTETQPYTNYQ
jgi:hypothetical protein